MKIKIAFIQLIPGKSTEENLSIGKKACIERELSKENSFTGNSWRHND